MYRTESPHELGPGTILARASAVSGSLQVAGAYEYSTTAHAMPQVDDLHGNEIYTRSHLAGVHTGDLILYRKPALSLDGVKPSRPMSRWTMLRLVATAAAFRTFPIRTPLRCQLAMVPVRSMPLVAQEPQTPEVSVSALERVEIRADAPGVSAEPGTFKALGVSLDLVVANIAEANITAPNALQRAAFAPIASGRDAILHAWTGSGKTLAFMLPLLEHLDASSREPQALIICPSRELAFQIARVANAALAGTKLSAVAIVGGANPLRQLEKIKKERPQLLVGTPGRIGELAFDRKKLKLQRIRHVVVDEVDDALRPPHLNHTLMLLDSMQDGRPLQLVLASATADTPPVRRAASQLLNQPLLLRLLPPLGADGHPPPPPPPGTLLSAAELPSSILHGVWTVEPQKGLKAVHALYHATPAPKVLVFVNSPHRVKVVVSKLWEVLPDAAIKRS